MSDAFCFIPAKLASTRLKEKNILKLKGKELIAYSIEAAKESGLFESEIIVSSESEEIQSIAESYGARAPYLREEKLARDPYGIKDVLLDFLDKFPSYTNYEYICVVLPTSPLLSEEDLTRSYELIKNSDFDVILSVCQTDHNSHRSITIENNVLRPLFPELITKKSQELNPTYRINGAVAFLKTEVFLQKKSFFTDNVGTYMMPRERSIDIDTAEDLNYARFIMDSQSN